MNKTDNLKEYWKDYSQTPKRKKYVVEWKKKNRKKINKYQREYYIKNRNKYRNKYRNRQLNGGFLLGTSGIGRKYEKIANKLLPGSIDCNKSNFKGGYDLIWKGKKIEVKMRNLNKRLRWQFTTKKTCIADYYLLFCVLNGEVKRIYFVPSNLFKNTFCISLNGLKHQELLIKF